PTWSSRRASVCPLHCSRVYKARDMEAPCLAAELQDRLLSIVERGLRSRLHRDTQRTSAHKAAHLLWQFRDPAGVPFRQDLSRYPRHESLRRMESFPNHRWGTASIQTGIIRQSSQRRAGDRYASPLCTLPSVEILHGTMVLSEP